MSYFDYEHKILEKLNKLLKIESINITNNAIRLNFANNFHCEFDKKLLQEAYAQGYSEDFISRQIKIDICSEYVGVFLEK